MVAILKGIRYKGNYIESFECEIPDGEWTDMQIYEMACAELDKVFGDNS